MERRVVFKEANWTTEQQDKLRALIQKLGLCGCGSGTAYELVIELLEVPEKKGCFYNPLPDASARWVEFGAHVLNNANLLEHGTGIGSSWLTDEGREVLRFLREFGTNDNDWPVWAWAEEYDG